MPLHKLLHLLPRFKEHIHSLTTRDTTQPVVHLTALAPGPSLMDSQNPSVQILIYRQQVSGCIIDGGFGVNVISEAICSKLGITEWELRPFLLRLADTRSVRPIGSIQNLELTLGGHAFTVSAVILRLDAPGLYPFLLGRLWLRTTNIKQHWEKNMIPFQRGKTKVCVTTDARPGGSTICI